MQQMSSGSGIEPATPQGIIAYVVCAWTSSPASAPMRPDVQIIDVLIVFDFIDFIE